MKIGNGVYLISEQKFNKLLADQTHDRRMKWSLMLVRYGRFKLYFKRRMSKAERQSLDAESFQFL